MFIFLVYYAHDQDALKSHVKESGALPYVGTPPNFLLSPWSFAFQVWTLWLRTHISPDSLAPDQWLRRISIKLQLKVSLV